MKASMGKLVLGMAILLAGMGAAYVIWNLLLSSEVVYISSRLTPISQTIPLFCTIPGLIAFVIWFFQRKGYVERTQLIDSRAFKFAGALILAVLLDAALGVVGLLLVGFSYIDASIVAYVVSLVLELLCALLALIFCPPYAH